jgi:hypothetical protein
VKIEDLADGFIVGIEAFGATLREDEHLTAVVQQWGQKLFKHQPSFPGVD